MKNTHQRITVKVISNAAGRPQRLAKGAGKQRTWNVDLSRSDEYNEGAAAGILGAVLGWDVSDDIRHGDQPGTYVNHSR